MSGRATLAVARVRRRARRAAKRVLGPRGVFVPTYTPVDNSTVVVHDGRTGVDGRARTVSVIATAYDEAETAARWLEAVRSQTRLPDEVVVVDAGSPSGEPSVRVEGATQTDGAPRVRVIAAPGANIAEGRNRAIAAAGGDVIAVTDLGAVPRADWLEQLVAPMEADADVDVVAGWYEAVDGDGRPRRGRSVPRLDEVRPATFLPSSRSLAFTKGAWRAVGGYPEWLTRTGEDTWFSLELKRVCRRWAFAPGAVVEWLAPVSLREHWAKVRAWSEGDGESGALTTSYWWSLLRLVAIAGAVASALIASALAAALSGAPAWLPVIVAVALAVGLAANARRLGAHVARVRGFLDGAARRPQIEERRRAALAGSYVILSGVPIEDTGGGARCTQIALELLRRGFEVTFVNRFPSYETTELDLRIAHPNLVTCDLREFDVEAWTSARSKFLTAKSAGGLVEFPLAEFLPVVRRLSRAGVVVAYDLLDDWSTSLGGDWYTPDIERDMVDACARLVTTAEVLAPRLDALSGGRRVEVIPNAVNLRLFDGRAAYAVPADLPEGAWRIIYVGALWGDWFDWDLLVDCARRFGDAAVVVIGDYRGQCRHAPANLHFLGLKPQAHLPAYLAHADVAIVPWHINDVTRATSPLKVYEYLAMRVPVVAPDIPPLDGVPYVARYERRDDFVDLVAAARGAVVGDDVDAFLAANSWEARVDDLLALLALSPAGR